MDDMFVGYAFLEETLVGMLVTRNASRVPTDATGTPSYRVYGPDGFMFSGTSAILDASNTNGTYGYEIEATSVNGFTAGKTYFILHSYIVSAVTYGSLHSFVVS